MGRRYENWSLAMLEDARRKKLREIAHVRATCNKPSRAKESIEKLQKHVRWIEVEIATKRDQIGLPF